MTINDSFFIPALVAEVEAILLSDSFNIEAEKTRRETVVSTRVEEVERSADGVVFDVRSVEYDRTRRGAVDRSRTVDGVTRFEWSRPRGTMRWSYDGVGRGFLSLSGTYRVAPEGRGTRFTSTVDVAVKVPVIGKLVARLVAREFARGAAAQRELLLDRATARTALPQAA